MGTMHRIWVQLTRYTSACKLIARLTVAGLSLILLGSCETYQSEGDQHTIVADQIVAEQTNNGLYKANLNSKANLNNKARMLKNDTDKNEAQSIEALSAVSFTGDHIRANVISHGCTQSDDFQVQHEVINGMCQLSVVRSKPDLCRRAPFVAEIQIAWTQPSDCADLPVVISNPLLVTTDSNTLIKRIK